MDHEIIVWLNSDRDYPSGLILHEKYVRKPNLGRILRVGGANTNNRRTLTYELGKIVKHLAVSINTPALVKPPITQEIPKAENPEPSEVISIETLRADQKMIYKMLDNLHAILPFREIKERKEIAFQILDLDDRLKEITERIMHFEKHGVILPEPVGGQPKKVSDMDTAELFKRQSNVRTKISQYKRLVADSVSLKKRSRNQELLDKYQLELDDINKILGQ